MALYQIHSVQPAHRFSGGKEMTLQFFNPTTEYI
jgi:hypothetical protein